MSREMAELGHSFSLRSGTRRDDDEASERHGGSGGLWSGRFAAGSVLRSIELGLDYCILEEGWKNVL